MSACPVADSLVEYEREMDRRDAEDEFRTRILEEHGEALKRRLYRRPGWLAEVINENRDAAFDLTLALDAAAAGASALAAERLIATFKGATEAKAAELINAEVDDYLEKCSHRQADPDLCEPDADCIDLSEWDL